MTRFGDLARDARIAARISLRDVALTLGYTPAYISDIERGNRRAPEPRAIRAWAALLGTDERPFVRAALADRDAVRLPLVDGGADCLMNRAAVALAERWGELDDDVLRQIVCFCGAVEARDAAG